MNIEISAVERDLLRYILSERLDSLHQEVRHTDSRSFKADLKGKENLIEHLLSILPREGGGQ